MKEFKRYKLLATKWIGHRNEMHSVENIVKNNMVSLYGEESGSMMQTFGYKINKHKINKHVQHDKYS